MTVCLFVCLFVVCMDLCTYVCIYVRTYVCTYTRTSNEQFCSGDMPCQGFLASVMAANGNGSAKSGHIGRMVVAPQGLTTRLGSYDTMMFRRLLNVMIYTNEKTHPILSQQLDMFNDSKKLAPPPRIGDMSDLLGLSKLQA